VGCRSAHGGAAADACPADTPNDTIETADATSSRKTE